MGAVNVATAELAVDSRCRLGEGIVWDARLGCLYWTDILSARLWMHVPATGQTHHWDLPEPLGCLALCEDGRLLLALAKSIRLAAAPVPGASLALETLCALEPELGASTRSNDGHCDRHGNFVFGTKDETGADPPLGRFYQFSAAHGLRPLPLPAAAVPNSICFSPDGATMYWCDTAQPRILRGDYDPVRASVSNVRVFAETRDGRAPDGSTVDAAGGLWNAHWDGGCVVRHRPDGEVDRVIAIPEGRPTCCAIGGDRFDTLYVTTARDELDDATLAAMPTAGGVFALALDAGSGIAEPRFRPA
jgi:L-arabinonolactonase